LEGLLEIVGLEVMVEGVRAGTHPEGCRERIPDCRSCNIKITKCGHIDGEQIGI